MSNDTFQDQFTQMLLKREKKRCQAQRAELSPALLEELSRDSEQLEVYLSPDKAKASSEPKIYPDEKGFRWLLNEDAMASDKLSEGIRKFAADAVKLEQIIKTKVDAHTGVNNGP